MLRLLSIGDLVEPGSYRFLNGSRRAVNMTDGTRAVTLSTPGADRGPLTVIVEGLDPESVMRAGIEAPGDGPGALTIDGVHATFASDAVFDSNLPTTLRGGAEFSRNLLVFGALLLALAPETSLAYLLDRKRMRDIESAFDRRLAEHTMNCVRDAILWNRRRGISRLSGSGIGLAPAGDDFIVGFLLGLGILENMGFQDWTGERQSVLEWTGLRDVVSTARLSAAARGRASESMLELVAALDLGDDMTVRLATERLLRAGASGNPNSGADTAVGFFITVREGLAGRLKGCSRTGGAEGAINESPRLWS